MTRLLPYGRAGGHVAIAIGAVVDHLAVTGEDGNDAGDLFLIDGLLRMRACRCSSLSDEKPTVSGFTTAMSIACREAD